MTTLTQEEALSTEYNPRYVEYARAHGMTAEEMSALWQRVADGEEPRPAFDRFALWHGERVREFASQWKGCQCLADVVLALLDEWYFSKARNNTPKRDAHALYDEWLKVRVDALLAGVL